MDEFLGFLEYTMNKKITERQLKLKNLGNLHSKFCELCIRLTYLDSPDAIYRFTVVLEEHFTLVLIDAGGARLFTTDT